MELNKNIALLLGIHVYIQLELGIGPIPNPQFLKNI